MLIDISRAVRSALVFLITPEREREQSTQRGKVITRHMTKFYCFQKLMKYDRLAFLYASNVPVE